MSKQLIISDMSMDFDQFVSDFQNYLQKKGSWKGNLTTMTGQTLIELVAALGTFDQTKINRAFQDCFAETAVSDSAIRACAVMQGVRMTRRLPAQIEAEITAPRGLVIPAYSQFQCAGYSFFNREAFKFLDDEGDTVTLTVTLYQGEVIIYNITGNGTNLQAWVSPEDNFVVSDQDVKVSINGEDIPVSYAGLWNYKDQPACQDLTTSTGRLVIHFGSNEMTSGYSADLIELEPITYGSVPTINDQVTITYCTTEGANGNNYVTINNTISIDGYEDVEGTALTNPRYGCAEKSTLTYKNNTASSFGTYGSAVTKSQYSAIVNTYPGVIDTITQAQREINPGDLQYMNVIWVTGVTTEPWDAKKKQEFCKWCEAQSMYSTRFVWVDAEEVPRTISMRVYCFNSAVLTDAENNVKQALLNLFKPRPGILMTNIYRSDIINAALRSDENISYVTLEEPTVDFIVTPPTAPLLSFVINDNKGGKNFEAGQYAYCVTMVNQDNIESTKDNWVHPLITEDMKNPTITLNWYDDPYAKEYRIYGRIAEHAGYMATVQAGTSTWTDNGTVTPDESKFSLGKQVDIKYNSLNVIDNLTVTCSYAERQQRLDNSLPVRG